MQLRVAIEPTGNRSEDLRIAARIRQALFDEHNLVDAGEVPVHGVHRDEQEWAYFIISASDPETVHRVIANRFADAHFHVHPVVGEFGPECQNCGNIAGSVRPAVCPNCHFRDISPCPSCGSEIPRQSYDRRGANLFLCPHCGNQVHLRFNEPMFLDDGTYNQPLVLVEMAEVRAS